MEKGVKVSVSGLLYTFEDIKAEPIAWILSRWDKDKTDRRKNWVGLGSRPGTVIQAAWQSILKMPVIQPSAQHRMVLILWDSTSRSKIENHC